MAHDVNTTKTTLQQQRAKEIKLLQNLQRIFHGTKQELNNDLTRLAVRNLPMMVAQDKSESQNKIASQQGAEINGPASTSQRSVRLSQSSVDSQDVDQLEPLDLDP